MSACEHSGTCIWYARYVVRCFWLGTSQMCVIWGFHCRWFSTYSLQYNKYGIDRGLSLANSRDVMWWALVSTLTKRKRCMFSLWKSLFPFHSLVLLIKHVLTVSCAEGTNSILRIINQSALIKSAVATSLGTHVLLHPATVACRTFFPTEAGSSFKKNWETHGEGLWFLCAEVSCFYISSSCKLVLPWEQLFYDRLFLFRVLRS